jgi:hypothetical protein
MLKLFAALFFVLVSLLHPSWQFISFSQPSPTFSRGGANAYYSFIDYQRSFPRPQEAMDRKMESLRKQFVEKKLS